MPAEPRAGGATAPTPPFRTDGDGASRGVKRLGVLGTFVWDTIWPPGGAAEPAEQWGGIAYSLAAISTVRSPGWAVVPIVRVGEDLADAALDFLASLRGVAPGPSVRVVPEPNNRVELRYRDAAERTERLTGGVSSWSWPELEPQVEGLDALYVNFLSGYELDLATATRLRRSFDGPIYSDLHSLFLGEPGPAARRPRRLPDWDRWLGCFDAVQLNRSELALLGPEPRPVEEWLTEIPRRGPLLALVTEGGEGARFACRAGLPGPELWAQRRTADVSPGEPLEEGRVAAPGGPLPGDPTGCGDIWGSVLFAGLLDGMPLRDAIDRAHRAAAARLGVASIADLSLAIGRQLAEERAGGSGQLPSHGPAVLS